MMRQYLARSTSLSLPPVGPAFSFCFTRPFSPTSDPTPQQQPTHWLDRHAPSLRDWLEEANRRWWFSSLVAARCASHPQLEGREDFLKTTLETTYQQLKEQHAQRIVDSRSKQHLSVACLAVATHKVLTPFIRDENEVLQIIKEHMGAQSQPALDFLMKATSWMQRDKYAALVSRLTALQLDYGAGFKSEYHAGNRRTTMTIRSCFYRQLYEEEEVPQLLSCSCCSIDRLWLEGAPGKGGVIGRLARSQAAGDNCCQFLVEKVDGRKSLNQRNAVLEDKACPN